MNIAYVLKTFPRYSQTFILNEILGHQSAACDLHVFALRRPKESVFHPRLAEVRAPIVYVDETSSKSEVFWKQLNENKKQFPAIVERLSSLTDEPVEQVQKAQAIAIRARQNGVQHLHAHFGNVAANVTRLASHLSGIPYSFTAHARDIYRTDVNRKLLRKNIEQAAFVATVSIANQRFLVSEVKAPEDKIHVVYNGLDIDDWQCQLKLQSNLVLGVGRLVQKKGFSYLVEACQQLHQDGVDFKCELVGEGELGCELQNQIDQLGLSDRVTLVGPMNSEQVKAKLSQARLLAVPSIIDDHGDREGLPTILIEAMASGVPCVATNVSGIPEAITHEETGLLVPEKDSAALADAIQRMLGQELDLASLTSNARKHIVEAFNSRQNLQQLRDLFKMSIENPARQDAKSEP